MDDILIIEAFHHLGVSYPKRFDRVIQDLTKDSAKSGLHLILSSSRSGPDLFTEKIKKCFPTKIAFNTASDDDSEVILGQIGAEWLKGAGDMLFLGPGETEPVRLQAPWIPEEEIVNTIKKYK